MGLRAVEYVLILAIQSIFIVLNLVIAFRYSRSKPLAILLGLVLGPLGVIALLLLPPSPRGEET